MPIIEPDDEDDRSTASAENPILPRGKVFFQPESAQGSDLSGVLSTQDGFNDILMSRDNTTALIKGTNREDWVLYLSDNPPNSTSTEQQLMTVLTQKQIRVISRTVVPTPTAVNWEYSKMKAWLHRNREATWVPDGIYAWFANELGHPNWRNGNHAMDCNKLHFIPHAFLLVVLITRFNRIDVQIFFFEYRWSFEVFRECVLRVYQVCLYGDEDFMEDGYVDNFTRCWIEVESVFRKHRQPLRKSDAIQFL